MSFMDSTCKADFMPELLTVGGRREWESVGSWRVTAMHDLDASSPAIPHADMDWLSTVSRTPSDDP